MHFWTAQTDIATFSKKYVKRNKETPLICKKLILVVRAVLYSIVALTSSREQKKYDIISFKLLNKFLAMYLFKTSFYYADKFASRRLNESPH